MKGGISMPNIDRPLGGAALRVRLGDAHRQAHIEADLLAG